MFRVGLLLKGQEDPPPFVETWGGESICAGGSHPAVRKVTCPVDCPRVCWQLLETFPWVWSAKFTRMTSVWLIHWWDWVSTWEAVSCTPLWGKPRKVLPMLPWCLSLAPPGLADSVWASPPCCQLSLGKSNSWLLVFSYFFTALSKVLFNYNVCRNEQGKMEFNTFFQSKWSKELKVIDSIIMI